MLLDTQVSWPGWETVRLIGQGSFGAVYEIQRQVFDDVEKAALKVISIPQNQSDIDELYSDGYDEDSITSTFQSHLKSIVAEYSTTRKMNDCVNIVRCDDVRYVQHDNGIGWDIFIKMELLTPLVKALPAVITEEMVIKLGKDLCSALIRCKKQNLLHRDIKPQNIFVSENGTYKLGDFGIAKTVEKTTGGTKIGTYKYMAPEVYHNQPYGFSADIYSLGMVLYWLLNERRMPFLPLPPVKLKVGMEEEARRRRMSGERLPAPAWGSEQMKRIVCKACAYDPHERYQTPDQMYRDLLEAEEVWQRQHPECSAAGFCAACGSVLKSNSKFCVFCGSPIEAPEDELVEEPTLEQTVKQEETTNPEGEPESEEVLFDLPEEPRTEEYPLPERSALCSQCGAALIPGMRFCVQCGTRIETAAPAVHQEDLKQQEQPQDDGTADPPDDPEKTVQQHREEEQRADTEKTVPQAPVCMNCGAVLPQDVQFCIYCGTRLVSDLQQLENGQMSGTKTCAVCGEIFGSGNRFCTKCGNPLS